MARLKPRAERELRSIVTRYGDLFPEDAAALTKLLDQGAEATAIFERATLFHKKVSEKLQRQVVQLAKKKPRERL
jgi:hypothetical protein